MTPYKHPLCNDVLRRPSDMTEEECHDLHIMRSDNAFGLNSGESVSSFWKPSKEEIAAINAGSPIVLMAVGYTHPPVSLLVLQPETEVVPVIKVAEIMTEVARELVSFVVKHVADTKDRRAVTDKFLDALSLWKRAKGETPTKP